MGSSRNRKSSVVGLGFGGSVSLSLGVTHPQRIEKLWPAAADHANLDDRHDFWRDRCTKAQANGLNKLGDITAGLLAV